MAVNGTNLEKAVVAVRNGMDVAKAAQKFGVNPQALANALNPNGGGKPEDGFEKSYDYKFPIRNGKDVKYVKASKIKTVTLKSGRKVEVFKDIEGKTRFQYRAADGKILDETYFKEKEGMTGKHYAINSKGQLVSVKDEADKKFSLPSGNSDNSEWNYAEATNKNLAEAWDMFQKGQMLDAVIKVLNGAENPNKSKYANDSAGMLEFVGGFWKKGGLTFLKQLKNIKSFGQFKTFVSGLMQKAKNVVKEGAAKVETKAETVDAKIEAILENNPKVTNGLYTADKILYKILNNKLLQAAGVAGLFGLVLSAPQNDIIVQECNMVDTDSIIKAKADRLMDLKHGADVDNAKEKIKEFNEVIQLLKRNKKYPATVLENLENELTGLRGGLLYDGKCIDEFKPKLKETINKYTQQLNALTNQQVQLEAELNKAQTHQSKEEIEAVKQKNNKLINEQIQPLKDKIDALKQSYNALTNMRAQLDKENDEPIKEIDELIKEVDRLRQTSS